MPGSVTLVRYGLNPGILRRSARAFYLTVQASGNLMPSEIFVYQSVPDLDSRKGDRFQCLATVNDLAEIPTQQAITLTKSTQIPYYRASQMSVVSRSAAEMEKIWKSVQHQTKELVRDFNSIQSMTSIETVYVGACDGFPTPSVSPLQVIFGGHWGGVNPGLLNPPVIPTALFAIGIDADTRRQWQWADGIWT